MTSCDQSIAIGEQEVYDYQTPATCGDCGGDRNVLDYCINCKANICARCKDKQLHKQHNVLARTNSEVRNAIALSNRPCKDHPDQTFVLFCDHCKIPCCTVCITGKHSGHKFTTFDLAAKDAKSVLEAHLKTETEITTANLEKTHKAIIEGISKYNEAFQKSEDMSRTRFQSLHNEFNRVENDWFEQMKNMKADDSRTMIELERKLNNELERRKQHTDICKSTLTGGSDLALLSLYSEIEVGENVNKTEITFPPLIYFKQSGYKLPEVKELIGETFRKQRREFSNSFDGSFCKSPQDEDPMGDTVHQQSSNTLNLDESGCNRSQDEERTWETDQTIRNKISNRLQLTLGTWKWGVFTCSVCIIFLSVILPGMYVPASKGEMIEIRTVQLKEDRGACSIAHTRDDDVWINGRYATSTLRLYDYNLKLKKMIQTDFPIGDMVLTTAEDLIVTDLNEQRVVKISNEHHIETLLNMAPREPGGLCMNDKHELVLALNSFGSSSLGSYSTSSYRKIKDLATFNFDIDQVKQNGNGDYVISGYDEIACVTLGGKYKWKYELQGRILGFVCDRYDNVILADYILNKIIVLSSEGKLIKTLMTDTDGISKPMSLSIDSKGYLWIGQKWNMTVVQYIT